MWVIWNFHFLQVKVNSCTCSLNLNFHCHPSLFEFAVMYSFLKMWIEGLSFAPNTFPQSWQLTHIFHRLFCWCCLKLLQKWDVKVFFSPHVDRVLFFRICKSFLAAIGWVTDGRESQRKYLCKVFGWKNSFRCTLASILRGTKSSIAVQLIWLTVYDSHRNHWRGHCLPGSCTVYCVQYMPHMTGCHFSYCTMQCTCLEPFARIVFLLTFRHTFSSICSQLRLCDNLS